MSIKNLKVITLNVRGITNAGKRNKILLWCDNQNADIAILQETHCTPSKVSKFKQSWKGTSFHATTDSPYSKGVSILIKENLDVKIVNHFTFVNGRALLLNLEIFRQGLTFVGIYAPNKEKTRDEFFTNLSAWILDHAKYIDNMVIGGDLNCCLLDNDSSNKSHIKDKSRTTLKTIMSVLNVYDTWDMHNKESNMCHYTWKDKNVKSRLDYIFVSKNSKLAVKYVTNKIVISDTVGQRVTDHKAVEVCVKVQVLSRGPGYWKFNCSLLKNEEYIQRMNDRLKCICEKLKQSGQSKFSQWEHLKREIKTFSIAFSTKLAKEKRNKFDTLEKELNTLNKETLSFQEITKKEQLQAQLDNLYSEKCRGAHIRARAEWVEKGERNNKYFLSLEKSRQSNNVIDSLKLDDGLIVDNQVDIIKNIGVFYETLYTSNKVSRHQIDEYLSNINIENIVSDEDKHELDKMPREIECRNVMMSMKDNRAPGYDGIPIEYYKCFWDLINDVYMKMINECWQVKDLPISMRTAILSLIHKSNDKDRLKNYRPISLMNSDYKILAFIFADRLQKVIHYIVNQDQSAYVKGRYIGCNIRNLIDIFEYCENEGIEGALLNIDYEKAFDSVEHSFIISVLEKFNFGPNFIEWIKIFYNNPIFRIKNNGWISKAYKMNRGIRQGCAMSSLIFILVVEILATAIRKDDNIMGILVGNVEHKIIQYADDSTIIMGNLESIPNVLKIINTFSKYAGPKLNIAKTKGIWLGPLKDLGLRDHCGITWTGNPVKCLGIYIGHNKEKSYTLNWVKKIENMRNVINKWKIRHLSIEGKILIVKTMVLSKLVFPATLLTVPECIIKDVKQMVFEFIWGGKDKVKRSVLINCKSNGGYSMVDIDAFCTALKASWVTKLLHTGGKWKSILFHYLDRQGMSINYILRMNFQAVKSLPCITNLPVFYQMVFLGFNHVKDVKPITLLSEHELLEQPIFGNELFQVNDFFVFF